MGERSPRYLDVAVSLDDEIRTLAPNSLLPTEQQLAKRFGVSRITVRGALDLLERNGSVTRLRGSGTTVSPAKITRHFSPLQSFEQDMASQGVSFLTKILSYDPAARAPDFIRRRLELADDVPAGCLSLLRLVSGRVVSHERRYYPPAISRKLAPEQVEKRDASEVLETLVGQRIAEVDWESEIVAAPGEVSAALGIAPRTLVLANTYCWHLEDGTPGEAGVISYRIDHCKFKYQISFDHGDADHQATPRGKRSE